MVPNGAVIPDPTFALSYALSDLYGPTVVLALVTILVTLVIVLGGLLSEIRAAAARGRMVPRARSAAAKQPAPAPEQPASAVAASVPPRHAA
jgi:Na+-transporting methylmalonyl-CoA/oxaloacetate decarboxylase gamma subunit